MELCFSEDISVDELTEIRWEDMDCDSTLINGKLMRLFFQEKFPNRKDQHLFVSKILDSDGNLSLDTIVTFTQNLFEFGEVVINEIMFDPEPEVYLPACEYIELFNNSDYRVSLENWLLCIHTKRYIFEKGELAPGEYLVLLPKENECQFKQNKLGLFTSASVLTNTGTDISLFDQYNRLIHSASYKEMSFYDPMKEEGGWSLEQRNPELSCAGSDNWGASVDPRGGTPGTVNSIFTSDRDHKPPEIRFIGIADTNSIAVHFSEPVIIPEGALYTFSGEYTATARPVYTTQPLVSDVITLVFDDYIKNTTLYSVNISEVSDCEGNMMNDKVIDFSLPIHPDKQSIVINELMYDPVIGGEEYLELYNASGSYLDVIDLKYLVGSDSYSTNTYEEMSMDSHLLSPKAYVVFAKNGFALRDEWSLREDVDFVTLPGWKSLPNETGYIGIRNRSDQPLVDFSYNDSMHNQMLMDPSGVSLERVSLDPGSCAWTSAAASSNYGTPGKVNSQFIEGSVFAVVAELVPSVFSPDFDGYNDLMEIRIPSSPVGSVISISITDLNGLEVLRLVENGICATNDRYFWDGHDMDHKLVFPGLYVVHIRWSNAEKEKVIRRTCAVSYR